MVVVAVSLLAKTIAPAPLANEPISRWLETRVGVKHTPPAPLPKENPCIRSVATRNSVNDPFDSVQPLAACSNRGANCAVVAGTLASSAAGRMF